jgi:hypothetical protein
MKKSVVVEVKRRGCFEVVENGYEGEEDFYKDEDCYGG